MHLHAMRLSAIGPFPGEHDIDFAELGASGVFLLEGPTGSGKSTIIDAIVFALYGKVASKGGSEDRLRSSYVGPEVESSVDLIFETGHGIYRVLRKPAHDRPKKRGTGTIRQNMQVQLWRLTSPESLNDGEQLSTRADEVGAEITRLVGLTRDQFVQTIVLPQGEFANFLSARPEERRGLLQRVFGTEIYDRIQAELVEARKRANALLTQSGARLRTAVDTFTGATRLTDDHCAELTELLATADTSALTTRINEHIDAANTEATAAKTTAESAATVCENAQTDVRTKEQVRDNICKRDDLNRRAETLEATAPEQARHIEQLDLANRAAHTTGFLNTLDRAVNALAETNSNLLTAISEANLNWQALDGAQQLTAWQPGDDQPLPGQHTLTEPLTATPAIDLNSLIEQHHEQTAALNRAAELETALPSKREQLKKLGEQLGQITAQLTQFTTQSEARPELRAALTEKLDAAERTAQESTVLLEKHAAAVTAHTNAQQAEQTSVKITELDNLLTDARTRTLAAEATVSGLRRARIDGIAGELAAQLMPNTPCAVCGSAEHPNPAIRGANHVDQDQIDAAEQRLKTLEQQLENLAYQRSDLATKQASLTAAAGMTVTAAARTVAGLAQKVRETETAEADATRLRRQLEEFDTHTIELNNNLRATETALAEQTSEIKRLTALIERDETEIRAALTQAPTHGAEAAEQPGSGEHGAAALMENHRQRITQLDRVRDGLAARRRALTELDRAQGEVNRVLAENRFNTADHARTARLSDAERNRLSTEIKKYDGEHTLITTGLREPAVAGLDPALTIQQAEYDVELAQKEATTAKIEADAAAQIAATKIELANSAKKRAQDITAAVAASHDLHTELAPTLRIANLVDATSSDNAQALTLGTYVLTRRFEEVLEAANGRLREMSSGRYELMRSSEKESHGGRRLGLAVKIVDHNTSTTRDPATLSGGETFYVSLCLALGLADIVTAEAGGVDLGTLFVDEGFGSLDPESLDLVMTELGKLRAGGRMVGVVSHVEAMKSTISDRISVRRTPTGASTLKVLAGT